MAKTFISIGECMAELQATDEGLYRLGFAGDTLNTAWYMRALDAPFECRPSIMRRRWGQTPCRRRCWPF